MLFRSVTNLGCSLGSGNYTLKDVVVKSTVSREKETAILLDQKNAVVFNTRTIEWFEFRNVFTVGIELGIEFHVRQSIFRNIISL